MYMCLLVSKLPNESTAVEYDYNIVTRYSFRSQQPAVNALHKHNQQTHKKIKEIKLKMNGQYLQFRSYGNHFSDI